MATDSDVPSAKASATSVYALGAVQRLTELLMTKRQLANALGKSERTIERWVRNRTAPPHIRTGNTIQFHVESVNDWLKRNEVGVEAKRGRRG